MATFKNHLMFPFICICFLSLSFGKDIDTIKISYQYSQRINLNGHFYKIGFDGYDCNSPIICLFVYSDIEKHGLYHIGDSLFLQGFRGKVEYYKTCVDDSSFVIISYDKNQLYQEPDNSKFDLNPATVYRNFECKNSWIAIDSINQNKCYVHVNTLKDSSVKNYVNYDKDSVVIESGIVTTLKITVNVSYSISNIGNYSCAKTIELKPNVKVIGNQFSLENIQLYDSVTSFCGFINNLNITGILSLSKLYFTYKYTSELSAQLSIRDCFVDSSNFSSKAYSIATEDSIITENNMLESGCNILKLDWLAVLDYGWDIASFSILCGKNSQNAILLDKDSKARNNNCAFNKTQYDVLGRSLIRQQIKANGVYITNHDKVLIESH